MTEKKRWAKCTMGVAAMVSLFLRATYLPVLLPAGPGTNHSSLCPQNANGLRSCWGTQLKQDLP